MCETLETEMQARHAGGGGGMGIAAPAALLVARPVSRDIDMASPAIDKRNLHVPGYIVGRRVT